MAIVKIQTDDKDIVTTENNLIIKAKIFSGCEFEDGSILEPKKLSLSRYAVNPVVFFGTSRIGKCESIVLSSDGKAITALIAFDGSDIGMSAYSWFRREILWSFVIEVDVNKSGSTLLSLGIDRYAPII